MDDTSYVTGMIYEWDRFQESLSALRAIKTCMVCPDSD